MALLTLFMGVRFEGPQVLTLYMLGWKDLVLGIPKMYHMLMQDLYSLVQTGLKVWGGGWVVGGLSKNLVKPWA